MPGLCCIEPPKTFVFLIPNPKAVSTTGGPVVEPVHLPSRPQVMREEYCSDKWAPRDIAKGVH